MMAPSEKGPEPVRPDCEHAVLCVDDEPAVLAALRRTLRREPYELVMARSPLEALEWAKSRQFSVVISDERMPGLSGTEMLRTIRESSPETLGILLTGYPEGITRSIGYGKMIRWLFVKPWDDLQMIRTIRRLLQERESGRSSGRDPDGMWGTDLGGEA
ncbi:MAG: response regulator [Planctomycetes bacterium]|nr:response regulator [Planctomycetota bacterium]